MCKTEKILHYECGHEYAEVIYSCSSDETYVNSEMQSSEFPCDMKVCRVKQNDGCFLGGYRACNSCEQVSVQREKRLREAGGREARDPKFGRKNIYVN